MAHERRNLLQPPFAPPLPVFRALHKGSYQPCYYILCQRLTQEELDSAASTITSARTAAADGTYNEVSNMDSAQHRCNCIAGHTAAEAVRS